MKHAFCICMALAMGLCAFCAQKTAATEPAVFLRELSLTRP